MSAPVADTRSAAGHQVGDPKEDSRGFRNALGQYGTGVAVVTALHDGTPMGMTVNSFAAVSLDPPLVLWSVRSSSARAEAYLGAERFAVNVLSTDQMDVSAAFASGGPDPEAFARLGWTAGVDGAPLVDGSVARFECRLHAVHEGGDHRVIVGEVERFSFSEGEPLIFVQGGYAAPKPFSEDIDSGGPNDRVDPADEAGETLSFAQLLTAASNRLSRGFDEHRTRFGLSVATGRVLQRLSRGPRSVEELASSAFLGTRAVEDALSQLVEAGLVAGSGAAYRLTETGCSLRRQVAASAEQFSNGALAGLSDADVDAARRVLGALASQ